MRRAPGILVPVGLLLLLVIPPLIARGDARSIPFGIALYAGAICLWLIARSFSYDELKSAAIGSALGMGIAMLSVPTVYAVADSPDGRAILSLSLAVAGFVIGAGIGIEKKRTAGAGSAQRPDSSPTLGKICDTSVLIDGRIAEMAEAGFIDGELVIPQFILHELQSIADSSDPLKRNRGRRGLDIVKRLQDAPGSHVSVVTRDFKDESAVDHKLIRLAEELGAALLTNDFNLNKVARVRHIKVLNINDLVNALKTIFLPGETLHVLVSREGKESGQGIAYLDDGTMVVIDSGAQHIGQEVAVIVTNIHQTTAGRMIFTRFEKSVRGRDQRAEKPV